MTKFLQITLLIVAVQWHEVIGKPLFQGINIQKSFGIDFKPLPRVPLTFLRESWSPFGFFGKKHSIQKRDVGAIVPAGQGPPVFTITPRPSVEPQPVAPVFEHVEEVQLPTAPFLTIHHPIPRSQIPLLVSPPVPTVVSPSPPPILLREIVTPANQNNFPPSQLPPEIVSIQPLIIQGALPPRVPPNTVSPLPPPRYTDIFRAGPVNEYLNSVIPITPNPVIPPSPVSPVVEASTVPPEPPKTDSPFIRGSKMALYFGNIFFQLISQFISNARVTLDRMTTPGVPSQ